MPASYFLLSYQSRLLSNLTPTLFKHRSIQASHRLAIPDYIIDNTHFSRHQSKLSTATQHLKHLHNALQYHHQHHRSASPSSSHTNRPRPTRRRPRHRASSLKLHTDEPTPTRLPTPRQRQHLRLPTLYPLLFFSNLLLVHPPTRFPVQGSPLVKLHSAMQWPFWLCERIYGVQCTFA